MTKKGFSLVELMVVVGILSIIMLVISQPVASVIKYQRESQMDNNMRDNLQFVINKMEKELKTSSGVTVISGGLGLTFTDQNAGKVAYCLSGQEIRRITIPDLDITPGDNCTNIPPTSPKLTENNLFKVNNLRFVQNSINLITMSITAESSNGEDTVTMQMSVLPLN
jgi:prepilin-type N-terminal cleavage/methylation domain-containing protein